MAYLTIGQVSKITGKSRSTLHKMAKNGDLSVAEIRQNGTRYFDEAEVFRVFPKRQKNIREHSANKDEEHSRTLNFHAENSLENKEKVDDATAEFQPTKQTSKNELTEYLAKQVEEQKKEIERLNRKLDQAEEKNNQLTDEIISMNKRLLPPPEEKKVVYEEPPKRKRFLGIF